MTEDYLKHEWIIAHGVVICRCCGEWKRNSTKFCMAKHRITTKDGKLKCVFRKKRG